MRRNSYRGKGPKNRPRNWVSSWVNITQAKSFSSLGYNSAACMICIWHFDIVQLQVTGANCLFSVSESTIRTRSEWSVRHNLRGKSHRAGRDRSRTRNISRTFSRDRSRSLSKTERAWEERALVENSRSIKNRGRLRYRSLRTESQPQFWSSSERIWDHSLENLSRIMRSLENWDPAKTWDCSIWQIARESETMVENGKGVWDLSSEVARSSRKLRAQDCLWTERTIKRQYRTRLRFWH